MGMFQHHRRSTRGGITDPPEEERSTGRSTTRTVTPYALLSDLYVKPDDWRPQWADHLSVVQTAGGIVYIAEPYQLYPEAFWDFCMIEAHGWLVQIDGQSTHNPGRTLRVCVTAKPAKA